MTDIKDCFTLYSFIQQIFTEFLDTFFGLGIYRVSSGPCSITFTIKKYSRAPAAGGDKTRRWKWCRLRGQSIKDGREWRGSGRDCHPEMASRNSPFNPEITYDFVFQQEKFLGNLLGKSFLKSWTESVYKSGVSNPRPVGCMWPRMAVNVAQDNSSFPSVAQRHQKVGHPWNQSALLGAGIPWGLRHQRRYSEEVRAMGWRKLLVTFRLQPTVRCFWSFLE